MIAPADRRPNGKKSEERQCHEIRLERLGFYQSVATTLCRGIFLISFFLFPRWFGLDRLFSFPASLLLGGFDLLLLIRFGRLLLFHFLELRSEQMMDPFF
ncbi:hypothetical protein CEXT_430991 [Caerostris extrusa]|uniref:Transmembrane protein n=1 Tax=Caerostris extrusa TaxID=172846 RepID=A0AAV4WZJ4_CAEEX|nr:hypothetical protein CEXT_430991 [Caerostris extrusa]